MSVITPPEDVAVVDTHEGKQSLLKRLGNTQSVWILGVLVVIVAFFSVAAGGKFLSAINFSLISQNIAVWAVLGVGMTFVIITSGHRPVDRFGARVLQRRRGEGDGGHGRRTAGEPPSSASSPPSSAACSGV